MKCGGFVNTYESVCDFYSVPIQSDICWDIDNLFYVNEVMEFSLSELGIRLGLFLRTFWDPFLHFSETYFPWLQGTP